MTAAGIVLGSGIGNLWCRKLTWKKEIEYGDIPHFRSQPLRAIRVN